MSAHGVVSDMVRVAAGGPDLFAYGVSFLSWDQRCLRGFLFYLLRPEPGPVGASVEPLGEALGPRVFPDGLWVLFGEVTEAPAFPVVLPFIDEPIELPLAAEPPAAELPPAVLPAEAPPACASAKVLESAKAVANAIVLNFMVVSLG
jgi:hypothetical protein